MASRLLVHATPRPCQVRRLNTAVEENTEGGAKDDDEGDIELSYVILDEAGAMIEPDAIGCLLHGASNRSVQTIPP